MPAPDPIALFVAPLERGGFTYLVTGAFAAIVYGEPRMTTDLDLLVDIAPQDIDRLPDAFPPIAYYLPPADALATEAARPRHGHFNILHLDSAMRADVYLAGDDPLHQWAFARVRREMIAGRSVALAPPEYVIVRKLEYHRDGGSDRHLRDVQAMRRLSGAAIDFDLLERILRERGLEEEWTKISEP